MSVTDFAVIDFHTHFIDPGWALPQPRGSDEERARWTAIHRLIGDERMLLADIESGDVAVRVVNTPTALFDPDAGPDVYRRINDQLALLAARHPGRIIPLASVDAFDGENAARELERAVRELGFRGVFVDSAKGDRLLDAPEALPALQAANDLRVPVFVHPINPQPLTGQLAPYGSLGIRLARGTVNAAALVALLRSGRLDQLGDLRIVVTALAFGGILLAAGLHDAPEHEHLLGLLRRHVHVDTMTLQPTLVRAAVDILGIDNVLAGSDWPIVSRGPVRQVLERVLIDAGLGAADRSKIGHLNARRLLALDTPA
ncbi:amidohydrolase family protein [Terrihabitans sp. B22-R8]|uniref:amidohydrolase family protein n=1 Tax=Terrihabitans sp. B22-R8 TaxID=3425128 RepID=UPI00403D01CC